MNPNMMQPPPHNGMNGMMNMQQQQQQPGPQYINQQVSKKARRVRLLMQHGELLFLMYNIFFYYK